MLFRMLLYKYIQILLLAVTFKQVQYAHRKRDDMNRVLGHFFAHIG